MTPCRRPISPNGAAVTATTATQAVAADSAPTDSAAAAPTHAAATDAVATDSAPTDAVAAAAPLSESCCSSTTRSSE